MEVDISIHITSTVPEIALHPTEGLLKNTEVPHHKKVVQPIPRLLLEQRGIALTVTQMSLDLFATVALCCPLRRMTLDLHQVAWEPTVLNYTERNIGVGSLPKREGEALQIEKIHPVALVAWKEATGSLHLVLHKFLRSAKGRSLMNADVNESEKHHLQEDCPGTEIQAEDSVESRSGSEAGRETAAARRTAAVGMKVNGREM